MPKIVEIPASIGKILLLIAGGIGFVVLGFGLVIHSDLIGAIVGVAAILFFGACTLIALWRLTTLRGTVVTLSRQGIQDIRIAPEFVRWDEIQDISTWQATGQKVMVLTVTDETWERLSLSAIARRSRPTNRALGADGLSVSSTELKIKPHELLEETLRFWRQATRR